MSNRPNEIEVYRTGDRIGLNLMFPNHRAETIYLGSLQAERLAKALNDVLLDNAQNHVSKIVR